MSQINKLLSTYIKEQNQYTGKITQGYLPINKLMGFIQLLIKEIYEGEIGLSIIIKTDKGYMELLECELIIDLNTQYKALKKIKVTSESLWSNYVKENLDRKIFISLNQKEILLEYMEGFVNHVKYIAKKNYDINSNEDILIEIY